MTVAPLFDIFIDSSILYGFAKDIEPVRSIKGKVSANGPAAGVLPVRGSDGDAVRPRKELITVLKLAPDHGVSTPIRSGVLRLLYPNLDVAGPNDVAVAPLFDIFSYSPVLHVSVKDIHPIGCLKRK